MNKTIKKVILSLILISVLFFTVKAFATETALDNTVNSDAMATAPIAEEGGYIPEEWRRGPVANNDSIINENVFSAEEIYTLEDKTVEGDMFVFAIEKINMKNVTVNGNAFLFSDKANLENVTVNGSAYVFAMNFDSKELSVNGNLYLLSEDATLTSNEMSIKDFYVFAEELDFKAPVLRDAIIAGDDITVEDGTVIGRNFTYPSDKKVVIGENVTVSGNKETFEMDAEVSEDSNVGTSVVIEKDGVKDIALSVLGTVLVSGIVLIVVVLRSSRIVKISRRDSNAVSLLKTIGAGFVFFVVSIVLAVIVMITIVGIPLSIIWILMLIIFVFISAPVAAVAIVSAFTKEDMPKSKLYFMSLLVLVVLAVIDNLSLGIVSGLISFAVTFIGLGTIYYLITNKDRKIKDKKENEVVTTGTVVEEKEVKDASDDLISKIDEIDKIDEIK